MIKKVVSKHKLSEWSEIKDDLRYWLSRTPQERIEAVEFLRRQHYGDLPGLQRTVRIIKRI